MQRWLTFLAGAAVVAVIVLIFLKGFSLPKPVAFSEDGGDGGAHTASWGAGDAGEMTITPLDGSDLLLTDLLGPDPRADGGVGSRMPDGSPVPPLPPTTPRQVRFGVVLISYVGAQSSATGQPSNTRSKQDAKDLATRLAAEAQADFHSAVQRGDPGSGDDLGHMKLGVLELAPEYMLFTLPVGGVSQPIDTPRGYWIAKRLE
jgi:PPIC-type peptidyl-prolyl cis-trans isomerase-like protein